jgi:hypothetical protein
MNRDWTRQKLEQFAELARRYEQTIAPGEYIGNESLRGQLYRAEPTVRKILEALDRGLAEKLNLGALAGAASAVQLVHQALGILADMDDWAAHLGTTAPTLAADRFHPWIWQSAQTLWESKHYRMAVNAAATAVCAHTQTKIGRSDIYDDDLMNQAFSANPKPGQAYLRIPGDQTDKTVKSRNNALRPFAQGCRYTESRQS